MTVCIAGVYEEQRTGQSSIFLICDRRISLFGGFFSHDGNAKYTPVHRDWIGMFAGSVEETNLMLKEVNKALGELVSVSFENAVDCCRTAYVKVRKRLIETQILPDFDVSSYAKYTQLKRKDEALYLTIRERIVAAEENWNLLFAGFDDQRRPHLFVISGPGKVEYCDSQKYAAIGSGAFAALIWLSFYGYSPGGNFGDSLFGAISAKFFAEKASDVGQLTVVSMISSHFNALFHLVRDEEIINIRKAWESLPKKSPESVTELNSQVTKMLEMATKFTQSHLGRSKLVK